MITGHSTALESLQHTDIPALHRIMSKPFRGRDLARAIVEILPQAAAA